MAGMSGTQGQQSTSGVNIRAAADNRATGNMQGHDMSGMDMGTMSSAPDMRQMMAQCDQMDRQMGAMPGMGAQAPAGTRSR